jgi:hypothetical protein
LLRRVEDASVKFKPKRLSKNGKIEAYIPGGGWHILAVGTQADYDEFNRQQASYPMRIATVRGRTYWQFQDRFYWDNDGLTPIRSSLCWSRASNASRDASSVRKRWLPRASNHRTRHVVGM